MNETKRTTKRTMTSENDRKTKLFEAWTEYFKRLHSRKPEHRFDEIYEGIATVWDLSQNRMGLQLEDNRKLRQIAIDPEVSQQTCRHDMMYVVLGRRQGLWKVLDVMSIGSSLKGQDKAHITFNPLYVSMLNQSQYTH